MRQREKIIPQAKGTVLEVGIGSGLNLRFYDPRQVTKIFGFDPSAILVTKAEKAASEIGLPLSLLPFSEREIPLEDHVVDTVVVTYTLCSIANVEQALKEISRVLAPEGLFIFCEHGAAPDRSVLKWQKKLTPLWKKLGGGCHLDRRIDTLIAHERFDFLTLEKRYIPGWRPVSFNYWGIATHKS